MLDCGYSKFLKLRNLLRYFCSSVKMTAVNTGLSEVFSHYSISTCVEILVLAVSSDRLRFRVRIQILKSAEWNVGLLIMMVVIWQTDRLHQALGTTLKVWEFYCFSSRTHWRLWRPTEADVRTTALEVWRQTRLPSEHSFSGPGEAGDDQYGKGCHGNHCHRQVPAFSIALQGERETEREGCEQANDLNIPTGYCKNCLANFNLLNKKPEAVMVGTVTVCHNTVSFCQSVSPPQPPPAHRKLILTSHVSEPGVIPETH